METMAPDVSAVYAGAAGSQLMAYSPFTASAARCYCQHNRWASCSILAACMCWQYVGHCQPLAGVGNLLLGLNA